MFFTCVGVETADHYRNVGDIGQNYRKIMDADVLFASLLKARNEDGGWSYGYGRSWTESTALGLLALQGFDYTGSARTRAAKWLLGNQTSDGGWAPCAAVPQSTWVTNVALLSLAKEERSPQVISAALDWVGRHVYQEESLLAGTLQRWFGVAPSRARGSTPWFPGTAGWVFPTAFSILALSRFASATSDSASIEKVRLAQSYLLSRRCADGGWNHGGSPHRSENANSYAETTGVALLALANCGNAGLTKALALAERLALNPDSVEGYSWLQMALRAHHCDVPDVPPKAKPKTPRDLALYLIARASRLGRNPLLH